MHLIFRFVIEVVLSPHAGSLDTVGVAAGDFGEGDSVDVAVDSAFGGGVAFVSVGDFYASAGDVFLEVGF